MLRITVELVPFGLEKHAKKIGTMLIANDGDGDGAYDNYVWACEDDQSGTSEGVVLNHDRSMNVWALIGKCLKKY